MKSRVRGFSLVELLFSLFLGGMVSIALLLSITSTGYAQARSERLFAADMVLTDQAESAFQTPYDDLSGLIGEQAVQQNGFEFELTTQSSDHPNAANVNQLLFTVSWEDKTGRSQRSRTVLRAKPR